jgi:hypothetical protein
MVKNSYKKHLTSVINQKKINKTGFYALIKVRQTAINSVIISSYFRKNKNYNIEIHLKKNLNQNTKR